MMMRRRRKSIHFVVSVRNLLVEGHRFVEQEKGEWTFRPRERFLQSFFFFYGWREEWERKENAVRVFIYLKEEKWECYKNRSQVHVHIHLDNEKIFIVRDSCREICSLYLQPTAQLCSLPVWCLGVLVCVSLSEEENGERVMRTIASVIICCFALSWDGTLRWLHPPDF